MGEWRDDLPDWRDAGRRVRVLLECGAVIEGELSIDDFFCDGEGEETPMFYVNLPGAEKTFLLEHEGWQFV
ncbi:hypothetical protein [Azotobacter vinelandii]|uniref:hypothetical protein n=1 Tax=Azotobacter vinelandii TaxID=354 RepID=UPI00266612EC|nr:hypothetical protein [Azotobacter vinelandii]WKN20820.1 hypothetical protein AVAEIV_003845 [Azotobacter vinelandii]